MCDKKLPHVLSQEDVNSRLLPLIQPGLRNFIDNCNRDIGSFVASQGGSPKVCDDLREQGFDPNRVALLPSDTKSIPCGWQSVSADMFHAGEHAVVRGIGNGIRHFDAAPGQGTQPCKSLLIGSDTRSCVIIAALVSGKRIHMSVNEACDKWPKLAEVLKGADVGDRNRVVPCCEYDVKGVVPLAAIDTSRNPCQVGGYLEARFDPRGNPGGDSNAFHTFVDELKLLLATQLQLKFNREAILYPVAAAADDGVATAAVGQLANA